MVRHNTSPAPPKVGAAQVKKKQTEPLAPDYTQLEGVIFSELCRYTILISSEIENAKIRNIFKIHTGIKKLFYPPADAIK